MRSGNKLQRATEEVNRRRKSLCNNIQRHTLLLYRYLTPGVQGTALSGSQTSSGLYLSRIQTTS